MKFKMYSSLVMGILCTMTGAFLLISTSNRVVTNFFFLAGLISEVYFLLLFVLINRIKTK